MPNSNNNRGGSHEQHVRAGEQSHKNDETRQGRGREDDDNDNKTRGGSHEQHVKAGRQSHKND